MARSLTRQSWLASELMRRSSSPLSSGRAFYGKETMRARSNSLAARRLVCKSEPSISRWTYSYGSLLYNSISLSCSCKFGSTTWWMRFCSTSLLSYTARLDPRQALVTNYNPRIIKSFIAVPGRRTHCASMFQITCKNWPAYLSKSSSYWFKKCVTQDVTMDLSYTNMPPS